MKIKNTSSNADLEISLNLLDQLVEEGIITDKPNQVLGVTEEEITLSDVYPSQALSDILAQYPDYKLITDPSETNAFKPEDGLPDITKVGTVQDPNYDNQELSNKIELFPDGKTSDNIIKSFNKVINMKQNRKNFNELDENGVAVAGKQADVESTAKKDDANYNPSEGEFSSVDVEPFSQEEIDKANDVEVNVNGNSEVKVFSEEEIDEMTDPEEIEETVGAMEQDEQAFSDRKKHLFAAKRRLHRINSKFSARKSFAEELTDKEQSDVIEDIVAILQDAPEIREAVAEEVDELQGNKVTTESEEAEEPVVEETTEEPVVEETEEPVVEETASDDDDDDTSIETMAFSDEEINEVEGQVADIPSEEEAETEVEDTNLATDDSDMTGDDADEFTEGGIDDIESDDDEVSEEEESEYEAERAGNLFCKAFSDNSVAAFKRGQLAKMAERTPGRNRF